MRFSKLKLEITIGETMMKIIIIHNLKLEYKSFVVIVQKWCAHPSLVEFENFLTS